MSATKTKPNAKPSAKPKGKGEEKFPITVSVIRKQFPVPMKDEYGEMSADEYCVMGALGLFLKKNYRSRVRNMLAVCGNHPAADSCAPLLQKANPNLTYSQAVEFTDNIIEANDGENFKESWQELGKALKAKRREEPEKEEGEDENLD